jgi:hypothetical protein
MASYTNVIYNLCQLIINLTVVNTDWKEVCYNAVKRNWTITYFTSVLTPQNLMKLYLYSYCGINYRNTKRFVLCSRRFLHRPMEAR